MIKKYEIHETDSINDGNCWSNDLPAGDQLVVLASDYDAAVAAFEVVSKENRLLIQANFHITPMSKRIAQLEAALREIREWLPLFDVEIYRSGEGTKWLDRIDALVGSAAETKGDPACGYCGHIKAMHKDRSYQSCTCCSTNCYDPDYVANRGVK